MDVQLALVSALVAIVVVCLIAAYGETKRKIGKLEAQSETNKQRNEREEKAKQIETQPPPNTPDAVADAWSGMRLTSKE